MRVGEGERLLDLEIFEHIQNWPIAMVLAIISPNAVVYRQNNPVFGTFVFRTPVDQAAIHYYDIASVPRGTVPISWSLRILVLINSGPGTMPHFGLRHTIKLGGALIPGDFPQQDEDQDVVSKWRCSLAI
jgi:hypothetical protein